MIFNNSEDKKIAKNLIYLNNLKIIPIFVFNNYFYKKNKLESFFFKDYLKEIIY